MCYIYMIPYVASKSMLSRTLSQRRARSFRYRFGQICLYIALVLTGCLLGGCNHKELLYPEEMCLLDVRFVWDRAQGASPDGMTLLFYPHDAQGEFWRHEIAGANGGTVEISQGDYTLIAINNDLAGVRLTDWPYPEASLTAVEGRYDPTNVLPTGMAYEGKIETLRVFPGKVSYTSKDGAEVINSPPVVYCHPDSVTTVYTVLVEDVDGTERLKNVTGILSGCARGALLSDLEPMLPTVDLPFAMEIDSEKRTLAGVTTGFPILTSQARYTLTLRVAFQSRGVYEKSFDITDQILNTSYPHNVIIHIKGLTLPDEPSGDDDEVGIEVDVDGWTVIEIDLES